LDTQVLQEQWDQPVHKVYKVTLEQPDQLEPQVQKVFVDLQDYKVQLVLREQLVQLVQQVLVVCKAYQLIFLDQDLHLLLYLHRVTQSMMRI
jgi:hypothetical protein